MARLAAQLDLNREATGKVAPKSPVEPQDRRPIDAAPRYSRQGHRRRISYVQDIFEPPGWCTAAWCGRRVTARRWKASMSRGASRCPASSRWCATARSSASSPSARNRRSRRAKRWPRRAKWKLGPELPDPANIHAHLKSLPSKDEVIGVKQAPALARRRAHVRGDLHQALSGAWLDRAVLRDGDIRRRQDDRSGRIRRACFRCATNSSRR